MSFVTTQPEMWPVSFSGWRENLTRSCRTHRFGGDGTARLRPSTTTPHSEVHDRCLRRRH
jgi:hypothetical protein